jgi:hypothetical protein
MREIKRIEPDISLLLFILIGDEEKIHQPELHFVEELPLWLYIFINASL